ncbi:hypothetical protein PGB90_003283 [Kerria lacca]
MKINWNNHHLFNSDLSVMISCGNRYYLSLISFSNLKLTCTPQLKNKKEKESS